MEAVRGKSNARRKCEKKAGEVSVIRVEKVE